MENNDIENNFDKILNKVEIVLKDNDLYKDETRDKIRIYLEKFYSISYYNYENKNKNFYAYDAELKSIPICNESEDEFILRKLVIVLLQYVFNIFHFKINPNKITLKQYLLEDYKYINDTSDFDKEICKSFKQKIISLMNKMKNSTKTETNYICKFFNTRNGCKNGDKCYFTHIREKSTSFEPKDL